jgi:hypothetical protein
LAAARERNIELQTHGTTVFLRPASRAALDRHKMGRLGTLAALAVVILMIGGAWGDVYMHNPRGCNNRLNEESANRANNNRMCDTQVCSIRPPPLKANLPHRFDLRQFGFSSNRVRLGAT